MIFWPKFPCPPLRQNTYSPFLFAICDYFNVQLVFSFHSVKLHSTRDIFSLPTNFFKKERNCGRKKKETRQIFSFFFLIWKLKPLLVCDTPNHTHTHKQPNAISKAKKGKKLISNDLWGFLPWVKRIIELTQTKQKLGFQKIKKRFSSISMFWLYMLKSWLTWSIYTIYLTWKKIENNKIYTFSFHYYFFFFLLIKFFFFAHLIFVKSLFNSLILGRSLDAK